MLHKERYIMRFTPFIEQAQNDARKIRHEIKERIHCENLFADLELSAKYLVKRFSDSFEEVKENINVREDTNNAIALFIETIYNKQKNLKLTEDYYEFSKFVSSEIKKIEEIIKNDSISEVKVEFIDFPKPLKL